MRYPSPLIKITIVDGQKVILDCCPSIMDEHACLSLVHFSYLRLLMGRSLPVRRVGLNPVELLLRRSRNGQSAHFSDLWCVMKSDYDQPVLSSPNKHCLPVVDDIASSHSVKDNDNAAPLILPLPVRESGRCGQLCSRILQQWITAICQMESDGHTMLLVNISKKGMKMNL